MLEDGDTDLFSQAGEIISELLDMIRE